MSRLITLIYMILSILTCQSCVQKTKSNCCSQFKTGRFEVYSSDNKLSYIIERDDEFQIEFESNTNKFDIVSTIHWKDDCKYYLSSYYKNGDSKLSITDINKVINNTAYTLSYREHMKFFQSVKLKFVKISDNNSDIFNQIVNKIK